MWRRPCGPFRRPLPGPRVTFPQAGAKGRIGERTSGGLEPLAGTIPFQAAAVAWRNHRYEIRGPGLRKTLNSSDPVDRCRDRRDPCSSRAATRNDFENAGRDGEIRTPDPLNPIQVRYQTAPRPGLRMSASIAVRVESRDDFCHAGGRESPLLAVLVAPGELSLIRRLHVGGREILVQRCHQVLKHSLDLGQSEPSRSSNILARRSLPRSVRILSTRSLNSFDRLAM